VKARALDPGSTETVNLVDDSNTEVQAAFDEYASDLREQVRSTGEDRSRIGDLDGFDEARRLIRELAETGGEFDVDDIRGLQRVGSPQVLGAAFGALRREGVIEVAGYTIATAIPAHGRLIRRWRGVSP
jgi:hypothetical protein